MAFSLLSGPSFVPIFMMILPGSLLRYGIRWNIRSSAFAPGRKRIFTFLFPNSLASLNSEIMESPTIKVVPFFHLIDWVVHFQMDLVQCCLQCCRYCCCYWCCYCCCYCCCPCSWWWCGYYHFWHKLFVFLFCCL